MPNFIIILGPQAVGKMTVGQALAKKLGYKFSHNHHSIEFSLQFYEYGTEQFNKINRGIRDLLFRTVSQHERNGFIFTYVLSFNLVDEILVLNRILNIFTTSGDWRVYFVELEALLDTRLLRNQHSQRLQEKASKRDVEASEQRLLKSLEDLVLNSTEQHPFPFKELGVSQSSYVRIKNDVMTVEDQVDMIIDSLKL